MARLYLAPGRGGQARQRQPSAALAARISASHEAIGQIGGLPGEQRARTDGTVAIAHDEA